MMKKNNVFDSVLSERKEGLESLRFSRFVHRFKQNEVVALYHSLTHQVVYLDINLLQDIEVAIERKKDVKKDVQDVVKELIKEGFLVSLGYREERIIQEINNYFLGKPVFGILYLILTDACNLRCKYCYIEGAMPKNHIFSVMSRETAVKAVDLFAQLLRKNPPERKINRVSIIFYGGEPLLNKKAFIAALDEISRIQENSELPSNLSVSVVTNGTIIDDEILEVLKKKNISVSVSLDGFEELHNANRIFANRKGTYHRVIKTIYRLQEAGVKVSLSCTITNQNLNQLEEVFKWMVRRFRIKTMGFNLPLDLPGRVQGDKEYIQEATEKIIKCYQIGRKEGIYEDRIMRKVNTFVKRSLHIVDCGGCGNQIVVLPDGRIGPCHAYMGTGKFFPARIEDLGFDPFQDPVFVEWSRRSPFNIPECWFCPAIGLCGGGCPYNAELKFGSIWKIDPNFCLHTKQILEWLIWDLFEKKEEFKYNNKKGGKNDDE